MLPETIDSVDELDVVLSRPTSAAIDALRRTPGDILLLGVGGKMGPTLARMARRAADDAGIPRRIIGVSRFQDPELRRRFEAWGVDTIAGDLLDRSFLASLPDSPLVLFMTGMKFGSTGQEPLTWAMNVYLPALVCERYARSHIAAFSTGNVYGLVPCDGGGSVENDPPNPAGEYAISCLGRERIFEHFSLTNHTPVAILRLNYATELRYGVLVDLAKRVWNEHPVDLAMGSVNVIWQGDACAMTLCALADCASPAFILNVAGPELLRVREICERLGDLLGKPPRFIGAEGTDALLNNGSAGHQRYGLPQVDAGRMLHWVADWVRRGGALLGKPTHFEVRDGKF
jgi:nucleoside-diphosphate-sugar epimerase